jgi:hypothetical protein
VEYTGTALTAVFHAPISTDEAAVLDTVRNLYAKTGRTLLPPLGFNNTFAILVRRGRARSACGPSRTRRANRRTGARDLGTSSSRDLTAIQV